jgi:hypothetical protein
MARKTGTVTLFPPQPWPARASGKKSNCPPFPQGLGPNKAAAVAGGNVAGRARSDLERETGQLVVSPSNFLKGGQRELDPERLTKKGKQ